MNVIVFASRKGGSGKSTLAAHLAAYAHKPSRPCLLIFISSHSINILMCKDIACRLTSKLPAMVLTFSGFSATMSMIWRRVGSEMAWNTSLLIIILQVCACKYMCKDLLAQIFFKKI